MTTITWFFFFFWASCWNYCLASLDLGAGVEQQFNCLIVQNRQVMQFGGKSMYWTLEDNMVDGLFFCATLTDGRGGHTPFVKAVVPIYKVLVRPGRESNFNRMNYQQRTQYLAMDKEVQQAQNESTRGMEETICQQKQCNNQSHGICAKLAQGTFEKHNS